MENLGFTNSKTKNLTKSMDENSGTERKTKNLTKSTGEDGVNKCKTKKINRPCRHEMLLYPAAGAVLATGTRHPHHRPCHDKLLH